MIPEIGRHNGGDPRIKEETMAQTMRNPVTKSGRKVNVRPDTLDFRDKMFAPTLVEVPPVVDLKEYRRHGHPRQHP